METVVCPWCDTEIVWDEEFGPEDTCPHCNNELKGYRTVSLGRDDLPDEPEEQEEVQEEPVNDDDLWGKVDQDGIVPIYNTLEQYREEYDLSRYEASVSAILTEQEEAPECPQCHELLLLAGQQTVDAFKPLTPEALNGSPVLKSPFSLNVYVCPSCFHVHQSLAKEDRQQLVRNLSSHS